MGELLAMINSCLDFVTGIFRDHPLTAALIVSLALSIILTELVKSFWCTSRPNDARDPRKRRNAYYLITAVVHWAVVWRIYSIAHGPYLFDVVLFSPVMSAGFVWLGHRFIEARASTAGPGSMWVAILARIKPHRVYRKDESDQFDPDKTTRMSYKDDKVVVVKHDAKS